MDASLTINVSNLDALEDMLDIQMELLKKYVPQKEQEPYRVKLIKVVGRALRDQDAQGY